MALQLISKTTSPVGAGVDIQITWKWPTENTAAKSETVEVGHLFADISGLLEDHPLRDEYLEALGITE